MGDNFKSPMNGFNLSLFLICGTISVLFIAVIACFAWGCAHILANVMGF